MPPEFYDELVKIENAAEVMSFNADIPEVMPKELAKALYAIAQALRHIGNKKEQS